MNRADPASEKLGLSPPTTSHSLVRHAGPYLGRHEGNLGGFALIIIIRRLILYEHLSAAAALV